jgi:hypothetical protein
MWQLLLFSPFSVLHWLYCTSLRDAIYVSVRKLSSGCDLIYNALNISDSVGSNDILMVSNELENIWKEAVVV